MVAGAVGAVAADGVGVGHLAVQAVAGRLLGQVTNPTELIDELSGYSHGWSIGAALEGGW